MLVKVLETNTRHILTVADQEHHFGWGGEIPIFSKHEWCDCIFFGIRGKGGSRKLLFLGGREGMSPFSPLDPSLYSYELRYVRI